MKPNIFDDAYRSIREVDFEEGECYEFKFTDHKNIKAVFCELHDGDLYFVSAGNGMIGGLNMIPNFHCDDIQYISVGLSYDPFNYTPANGFICHGMILKIRIDETIDNSVFVRKLF